MMITAGARVADYCYLYCCRYVSYVTVLDMAHQLHWYMPCHEWMSASSGSPEMIVIEPGSEWHWRHVYSHGWF